MVDRSTYLDDARSKLDRLKQRVTGLRENQENLSRRANIASSRQDLGLASKVVKIDKIDKRFR